jgi:peroxiredoxin
MTTLGHETPISMVRPAGSLGRRFCLTIWNDEMIRIAFSVVAAVLLGASAEAGQFNRVLDIGDQAPAWQDLPGVDDQQHSFDELSRFPVVVVAFTCNSCPYAVDVEDRLVAFHKQYSQRGVGLVAINVNKVEEDRLPAMKEKATEKGFKFPYLFDESQKIARDYGAQYTPEFFVLDRQRKVVYMGSLDDSPDGKSVNASYVEVAVKAALEGTEPEVTESVPIGCRVRFERQRRSRKAK